MEVYRLVYKVAVVVARVVYGALCCVLLGCGSTSKEPVVIASHPWFAETTLPDGPVYLGNSSFGLQVPPTGASPSASGCFLKVGDRILEIASPLAYAIVPRPGDEVEGFWGRLDFHCSVYRASWSSEGKTVRVETIVDPELPVVAQRIWGGSFEKKPILELTPKWISTERIKEPVARFRVLIRLEDEFVERIAALEVDGLPRTDYSKLSYQALIERAHRARRGTPDIEIDGPPEDEQAIRSFLYYISTSANDVLPPFALSNASYRGYRFWDAEAWMLPVISLLEPDASRRATLWRKNAVPLGKVPWEAGPGGEDRTPVEFRSALHQAGWLAWWAERAAALGVISRRESQELFRPAIGTLLAGSTRTSRGVEFLNVESPDEGKARNNDLITNLLAKSAAGFPERIGRRSSSLESWGSRIVLPRRPDGLLATYDNDPLIKYQQAAALLALYPLEWPVGRDVAERMFDRYKDKVSDAGPAMSDAVHATIACRLGRGEEAYGLWHESWKPFVRPGTMQFCERRNRKDSYFMTGAAGCLQTVIYGFLGVRIGREAISGSPSMRLRNGYYLSVQPCLPKVWKSITFHNIHILGKKYTIRATHGKAEIIQGGN